MKFSLFVMFLSCFALYSEAQSSEWKKLLSRDISEWDTYLGPSYDTVRKEWNNVPVGLNNDPSHVFSMITSDGESVLRISGEKFGGISTKESFRNYHLKLEFKWGQSKYHPRKNGKRDSGLLYHAVGNHGADAGFWLRSQEFQVQEGDCGDYWGVAGGSFEVKATKKDSAQYVYDPSGTLSLFNERSPNGRRCIKSSDAELANGKWNTLELYCYKGTAVHVVNGKIVMILHNSGQLENGKLIPLTEGKIQIQSEGAEIFYRNIEIQSIDRIPAKILETGTVQPAK